MTPNRVSRSVISEVKSEVFAEVLTSTSVKGKIWRQVRSPNNRRVVPISNIVEDQLVDGTWDV